MSVKIIAGKHKGLVGRIMSSNDTCHIVDINGRPSFVNRKHVEL